LFSALQVILASTGDPVPTYDLQALVELMVDLVVE
jgi:hypothetical protein